MSIGILAGLALFLWCVWLVAEPFLVANAPKLGTDAELESRQPSLAQVGIDELELDYGTGKMSAADYESLKASPSPRIDGANTDDGESKR
jgi:hypothetical protein